MIYYIKPMHRQSAFADLEFDEKDLEFDEKDFVVTNELSEVVLSLPMHPYLSEEDVGQITNAIKTILNCDSSIEG